MTRAERNNEKWLRNSEDWNACCSLWRACFHLPVLCVENYLILCLPKTMIYSHYWFKMLYRLIFNPSIPRFSLSKAISWYCLQIMQSRMTSVRESSWGWQIIAVRTEEWLPWTFKKPQDVTEQNWTGSLCSWAKVISLDCVFLLSNQQTVLVTKWCLSLLLSYKIWWLNPELSFSGLSIILENSFSKRWGSVQRSKISSKCACLFLKAMGVE